MLTSARARRHSRLRPGARWRRRPAPAECCRVHCDHLDAADNAQQPFCGPLPGATVTLEDRREHLGEQREDQQHREELPAVAALAQDHHRDDERSSSCCCTGRRIENSDERRRAEHQPVRRDDEHSERPGGENADQLPVAVAGELAPDLRRPENEPCECETDARIAEEGRLTASEQGEPRDERRPGREGRRERREDLSFRLAEVAAHHGDDGDERGDRGEGRRAQQEDAPQRHG
jgi:hypothetical protein